MCCKKGDNDPLLSISSRKSRFVGEWSVTSYQFETSKQLGDTLWKNWSVFDGTKIYSNYEQSVNGILISNTQEENILVTKFDFSVGRDGNYTLYRDKQITTYGDPVVQNYSQVETEKHIEQGSWSFIGKAGKEFKNKERVVLNAEYLSNAIQQTTYSEITPGLVSVNVGDTNKVEKFFEIGEHPVIFAIDKLASKTMTLVRMYGGSSLLTSSGTWGDSAVYSQSSESLMVIHLKLN